MIGKFKKGLTIKSKKVLAIIPARGGSKGIPRKNIVPLLGKPLFAYTAEAALKSKFINRAILSTDDERIKKIALKYGLEVPFIRPKNLSGDKVSGLQVIKHAVRTVYKIDGYSPDTIIVLQPTSPLRKTKHIDEAIKIFHENNADSLVSVTKVDHKYNPYSVMKLNKDGTLQSFLDFDEKKNLRQLKPVFYARNGAAIYICTQKCLMENNSLFGEKILPYYMEKNESIDIDDVLDLEIAEMLLKKIK